MKLTPDSVERTIIANWNKRKADESFNPSETTHYLFDNLFRGLRYHPDCMHMMYDTLIRLNQDVGNREMVTHLIEKRLEFFGENHD